MSSFWFPGCFRFSLKLLIRFPAEIHGFPSVFPDFPWKSPGFFAPTGVKPKRRPQVAMSSRLGVVERSALLETLPSAPAELVQRFAHAMDRAKTGEMER